MYMKMSSSLDDIHQPSFVTIQQTPKFSFKINDIRMQINKNKIIYR